MRNYFLARHDFTVLSPERPDVSGRLGLHGGGNRGGVDADVQRLTWSKKVRVGGTFVSQVGSFLGSLGHSFLGDSAIRVYMALVRLTLVMPGLWHSEGGWVLVLLVFEEFDGVDHCLLNLFFRVLLTR